MKFVSKNQNLRIVLRQGLPAEPLTGRVAVPGVYVKFERGLVDVNDQETIDLMTKHSGYGRDFVSVDEGQADPYAHQRQDPEPTHQITQMEYGHMGRTINARKPLNLTPEVKKALSEMATEMAKQIAPQMAMEIVRNMASSVKQQNEDAQPEVSTDVVEAPKAAKPKSTPKKGGSSKKASTKK